MAKIMNLDRITLLDNLDLGELSARFKSQLIVSPICPDYHFHEVKGKDKNERVHDFDGMGKNAGIVYEKLINKAEKLFEKLEQDEISYNHILLVADVEVRDPVILKKLGLTKEEFLKRCQKTVAAINRNLKKRALKNSKCLLMSQFFKEQRYPFSENINEIHHQILDSKDLSLKKQIQKTQKTRNPLYQFWFGLDKLEGDKRTMEEMAMYASFGYCPKISQGIILCADSEVLSNCYNLLKQGKTPVLYIRGDY